MSSIHAGFFRCLFLAAAGFIPSPVPGRAAGAAPNRSPSAPAPSRARVAVPVRPAHTVPPNILRNCLAALQSKESGVRAHAADRLGRLGDLGAVPALIAALRDPAAAVRSSAARALGELRSDTALAALARRLDDPDPNVRLEAARALGRIAAPQSARRLVHCLLHDPEWTVREQAAWALRRIASPTDTIPPLVQALNKPGTDVQHVFWVLEHFPAAALVPRLEPLFHTAPPNTRMQCLKWLQKLGAPGATPLLLEALHDPLPGVRRQAIQAIAQNPDPKLKPALQDLAARDPNPEVRRAAREALYKFLRAHGLLAWWDFENTTLHGRVPDVSGGGNDGTNLGCPAVPGRFGKALRFSKGRYVEIGVPPAIPIAHRRFTVTAWAKPEAGTGVIVARGGAWCGFSLYIKQGIPKFALHRTRNGPSFIAAAEKPIPMNQWVFLAGVVRKKRIELYVGGRLAAKARIRGLLPSNCGQGMEIGFDVANSPAEITDPFQGVIDDVRVYSKALGSQEIRRVQKGRSPESSR